MIFDPNIVAEALANSLPGEEAHLAMSPLGRGRSSDSINKAENIRESAVALHVFGKEKAQILLTKRADYKGTHGGQISFPGGKYEEGDLDLEFTARRESQEETALPIENGKLLGALTEIFIPVSGFEVQPYVIYHQEQNLDLSPDPREVEELFYLPMKQLMNEELVAQKDIRISKDFTLKNVPCFLYEDRIIWGATAIILNEFKTLLSKIY